MIDYNLNGTCIKACGYYYEPSGYVRDLCHRIKQGESSAMQDAAEHIARLVPSNAVLIPIPNRCGYARETLSLVNHIKDLRPNKVVVQDILKCDKHESMYAIKKRGESPADISFNYRITHRPDPSRRVILVDNVVDTGTTCINAINAIGCGEVITLAISDGLLNNKL